MPQTGLGPGARFTPTGREPRHAGWEGGEDNGLGSRGHMPITPTPGRLRREDRRDIQAGLGCRLRPRLGKTQNRTTPKKNEAKKNINNKNLKKRRMRLCWVHVAAAQVECSYYVLQTWSNERRKDDGKTDRQTDRKQKAGEERRPRRKNSAAW